MKTKFTVVYRDEEGTLYTGDFKEEMSYETAVTVAAEIFPEKYEIVCIVESSKMYPNKK